MSLVRIATLRPVCPDGGTCHHDCEAKCWRVGSCGPLSGVYPGDDWPADVVAEHASWPTGAIDAGGSANPGLVLHDVKCDDRKCDGRCAMAVRDGASA